MTQSDNIDLDNLETALKNAVKPEYDLNITCPHCSLEGVTDNGEWLIWCGDKEHAQAILDASRAYLSLMRTKKKEPPHDQ